MTTRAIADHVFRSYDSVLRLDGDVGTKKAYDPRPYFTRAEVAIAEHIKQAVGDLRVAETTLFRA